MNTPLALLCLCFAGFVHGFTGFGYALVAMALLPLLVPMPEALFLGAVFMLPAGTVLFWRHRRFFDLRESWPLIAGAVAGTPLGLLLIHHLDPKLLIRSLGVMLIVFSVNELIFTRLWTVYVPTWLAFPTGVACGILGAAFNVGGPPAVVYVFARPWRREQAVATLQVLFLLYSLLRVLLTIDQVTAELAVLCLETVVPFILILILGAWLAERLPPRRFKQVVLVALIGMGARYAMM